MKRKNEILGVARRRFPYALDDFPPAACLDWALRRINVRGLMSP